jgi:hypothetical protein
MADLSPQYIAPNLAQPAEMPTTMSNELMAPAVPVDNQLTTNLNQFTQNVGVTQPTEGQLSKQMTALNLASSMPNLFLGMHTGLANKVNQRIEEGMITNYAMNGVTPYDAIQTELDKFEANQNAVNAGAQELTSLDEQLKAKMKENQDLQKLMMDSMLQKSDASGILAAQQRIADLQTKAPTAPDLQVPELKEADQALIFLAGLIGGNQAVPQAIQGAIAGARQRTEMANQLAAQKFNQEQQAFNKQASIEQALLQRETTKYNIDATNLRNVQDNYREISNIQQRAINLLTAKKADVKAKQLATISQSYKKLIDQAKTENEITEDHQKAIEALQKAAIAIGEDPNMFPKFDTIGLTAKGQAFEEKKKIDNAKLRLQTVTTARQNVDSILKTVANAPVITEQMAETLNNQIAKVAGDFGLDPTLFPKAIAGKPRATLALEWRQAVDNQRLAIAQAGLALARQREKRIASGEDGTQNKDLQKLIDDKNKAEGVYADMQYAYNSLKDTDKTASMLRALNEQKAEMLRLQKTVRDEKIKLGVSTAEEDTEIANNLNNIINIFAPAGMTKAETQAVASAKQTAKKIVEGQGGTPKPTPKPQPTPKPTPRPPALPGNLPPASPSPGEVVGADIRKNPKSKGGRKPGGQGAFR